ncbi:MAG TPA: cytochrome-c peroxidase [Verrucomicrobiae bacterium]
MKANLLRSLTGGSAGSASVGLVTAIAGLMAASLPAQVQTFTCPNLGFGPVIAPFIPLASLKTVANPVIPKDPATGLATLRADLGDYVANLPAAIRLGKALFWDMQAGSDDKTACATCHFQAGADVRWKNQLAPGPDKSWGPKAANAALAAGDFPFTDFLAAPAVDADNIAGSQGVRKSAFAGITKNGVETVTSVADPVFNVNGTNVRQVTEKNTPSALNAVFNHRQFHNGRAQPDFNGVNPFGGRDASAKVWVLDYRGSPVQFIINIRNASLASQAVGPPLNPTEMSASGRTFPDLGKKMLLRKPLGLQKVDAGDSVLGSIASATNGLTASYQTMIQQAFQPKWWNSTRTVSISGKSYTMMQANFSLFWGLAIMLYEATLVSDDSPMDQYLASRVFTLLPDGTLTYTANPALLDPVVNRLAAEGIVITRQDILNGLALFELPVGLPPSFPVQKDPATGAPQTGLGCIACHLGAETTSASMQNLAGPGVEAGDIAFKTAGFDLRMERMFKKMDWTPPGPLSPVPQGTDTITYDSSTYAINVAGINGLPVSPAIRLPVVTYDSGWYNIGVRPTTDDPGLGGLDPFSRPLSWTEYFQQTLANPGIIKVPGGGLGAACVPPAAPATSPFAGEVVDPLTGFPLLSGPLLKTEPTDVAGSFKTLPLRNLELNGPYFHNGGKATLLQVIEFYNEGGDFANPTKSPLLVPLRLSAQDATDLVALLIAFTDDRVSRQRAPFDHPQLLVPNGAIDASPGTDDLVEIQAVGAGGAAAPLARFLGLSPFTP